jgi:hypothetical protein
MKETRRGRKRARGRRHFVKHICGSRLIEGVKGDKGLLRLRNANQPSIVFEYDVMPRLHSFSYGREREKKRLSKVRFWNNDRCLLSRSCAGRSFLRVSISVSHNLFEIIIEPEVSHKEITWEITAFLIFPGIFPLLFPLLIYHQKCKGNSRGRTVSCEFLTKGEWKIIRTNRRSDVRSTFNGFSRQYSAGKLEASEYRIDRYFCK